MGSEMTRVEPMDSAKKNSDMAESFSGERTVILGEEKTKCFWNDAEFPDGNSVCDSGRLYKCHMGVWIKQDSEC